MKTDNMQAGIDDTARQDPRAGYLLNLLEDLEQIYEDARELMERHLKAVALQDINEIESVTEYLIDHYDMMAKLENHFKEYLSRLFDELDLPADSRKLTVAAEHFPEFQEEIDLSRRALVREVAGVQTLKDQVMELLGKAKAYNQDTLQLVRTFRDGSSVRYDGFGEKSMSDDSSIIFNQKV